MKNFIKSNYNMYPSKIYKQNDIYFFFSGSDKIILFKTNKDKRYLDNLAKIANEIYNKGILINTFLLNVNNEYFTKKDNYYIVLLKCNDINTNDISYIDIKKYNNYDLNLEKLDIINIMEKKIDALENEMTEYNKEYPIIQESLNYFIGISENAIQMLKNIKINNNSIIHNITIDKLNVNEFNNPFNLMISNKMHDFALYFKYKFYYSYIDYEELYDLLVDRNNTKEDLICFYSLMLYQKEYFDDVKEILLNKKDEKILYNYIDNINKYKELLKYIKNNLHNIKEILEFDWIDK